MSQCKKFAPNIFNKIKCSNCFRQKEEHSAVALECNRASRTTTRSGYLFLAPDWDFSVPLNRTKRWQRRWFVLYDDGELSYSVDEHPDTIPQGSVDMSQVVEVTSAEQLTGHTHSLALTAPDRVTFVKAASREEARWWLELLAVLPRRHKRNATFPGGRASPSLPHLGRSASPQPPRPVRHLVGAGGGEGGTGGGGSSPRTNFTTPPLKEERDSNATITHTSSALSTTPLASNKNNTSSSSSSSSRCSLVGVLLKENVSAAASDNLLLDSSNRPTWLPEASATVRIAADSSSTVRDTSAITHPRTEYLISSGSPPTRDKLRCDDKARARRDWRHERLRDIATALTDRSPESSLALPAEGLLHLKKGWLWHREDVSAGIEEQWRRRWWVLCGPSLLGYRDQEEEESGGAPLFSVELAAVTGYGELRSDGPRFGFQVLRSGGAPPLALSAVTTGIRSNWLQALRKAAPGMIESPPTPSDPAPTTTITTNSSSAPSSTSSSRHSTASSNQLNVVVAAAAIITHQTPPSSYQPPSNTGPLMRRSCRLSTGSASSGGGGTPTTPRSGVVFSSDEEYRTASEGGRRDSMTDVDWVDCGPGGGGGNGSSSSSMVKSLLNRSKDQRIQQQQQRSLRPNKLPRCLPTTNTSSSRQSTLDSNVSSSPDELDCATSPYHHHHHHLPYSTTKQIQSTNTNSGESIGEGSTTYLPHHQSNVRSRKLHLQLRLGLDNGENNMVVGADEETNGEEGGKRNSSNRRRGDVEKELEVARGEVRALEVEAGRLQGLLSEAASKELKGRDAVYELEKIERDLTLKLEKLLREQKSLTRRLADSDEAIREADERSATLNRELQTKQRIVASLQEELTCANERCAASRLENDRLYKKLQELNTSRVPTITPPPPAFTTITQLTNIDLDTPLTALTPTELARHCLDLRARFERAVAEIRELQHRLRDAHAHLDAQQLDRLRFGQRVDAARAEYDGRLVMLRGRVEDLTGKLVAAERQARVRARAGSSGGGGGSGGCKGGRRSLSLKGRESFSVSKDLEDKVTHLEAKLLSLEQQQPSTLIVDKNRCNRRGKTTTITGGNTSGRRSTDASSPIIDDRSLRRLRRKSLDGATTAAEPMKLLGRLNALEEKMTAAAAGVGGTSVGGGDAESTGVDEHSEMETLSLARAAYLQCLTTTTATTAPSTIPSSGHMLELGRILRVPNIERDDIDDVSAAVASAQSVVAQLERALHLQYRESYEKRALLRERGELDARAKMELLAEKIAFEDVIIGRLIESLPNTPTSQPFLTRATLETNHLITHLQSKLRHLTTPTPTTAPTSLHHNTSVQHLTHLFTKHLLANITLSSSSSALIPHTTTTTDIALVRTSSSKRFVTDEPAVMTELVLEQRNVHGMFGDYRRAKMGELVTRLVDDTVRLMEDDSCSLVEQVGGQVWDEARRRVSEELIQSEVRHVLMKTAQHYERINSADHTSGYSFTLTAVQRCQLDQWTDTVEDHLLTHLDHFIADLNTNYQATLTNKRRQLTLPHQRTTRTDDPNSTELLHEYADVIAHVALIDARVATLQVVTGTSANNIVVGTRTGLDESSCLNTLLLVDGPPSVHDVVRRDVSVAEFKAALQVARLCVVGESRVKVRSDDDAKVFETSVAAVQCNQRLNVGHGNDGSLDWVGTSYSSSYDSLPELAPPPDSSLTAPHNHTYHHQIALLRHAFHQTLATYNQQQPTTTTNTTVVCVCHQSPSSLGGAQHAHAVAESRVERLRTVCEQVLVAMERAHRTTLQGMRMGHRAEVEAVRRDKEQALAEETQATLAALDAMRKAHEAEVVKEVAHFKQELSRQQASELLELRERLSVKCLEAAALQEQLGSAARQLAHAHQHILHLEQQRAPSAS